VREVERFLSQIRYSPENISMDGGMDDLPHISDGNPNVLNSNRDDKGRWLNANWVDPDGYWLGQGASAFLVATLFISSPLIWRESFVLLTVPASRPAVCRSHPPWSKERRIFW